MMHFLFRQRKVHEMPKISATLALLTIYTVGVAAPHFEFDRQLAVELARAYIHSQSRLRKNEGTDRISYNKPSVVAAVDSKRRHLVFVTFASTGGPTGAYVVLVPAGREPHYGDSCRIESEHLSAAADEAHGALRILQRGIGAR